MAGQEGSSNNRGEASIPKFQYRRTVALTRAKFLPDFFMPRAVSLGPVHHKKNYLQVTKQDKCEIMEVLARNEAGVFDKEMKIALGKARDLYEREELDEMMKPDVLDEKMKPDVFDEMMILDACFIIHAIDYITKGESEVLDKKPHLRRLILDDMFLLENQVPIIVLEAAMKVLRRDSGDIDEFIKKEGSNENEESDKEKCLKRTRGQAPSHLLHLLWIHLSGCSEENQPANTNYNMRLAPRHAAGLTAAGIKFQRSPTSSVKDVKFKKGITYGHLFLPSLAQLTKTSLVNLMAYELCQGVTGHGITSYVSFLNDLIDCPEDVKELRSTQILPKALGDDDEDVVHFFHSVGTAPSLYYNNVLKEIESHCHSRWRPSTAKFCEKHFSSPWTTVSFLIAILLFVITIATAFKTFFGR